MSERRRTLVFCTPPGLDPVERERYMAERALRWGYRADYNAKKYVEATLELIRRDVAAREGSDGNPEHRTDSQDPRGSE